jgi:hypothetical protein
MHTRALCTFGVGNGPAAREQAENTGGAAPWKLRGLAGLDDRDALPLKTPAAQRPGNCDGAGQIARSVTAAHTNNKPSLDSHHQPLEPAVRPEQT